jgi:hypothetical protein
LIEADWRVDAISEAMLDDMLAVNCAFSAIQMYRSRRGPAEVSECQQLGDRPGSKLEARLAVLEVAHLNPKHHLPL